MAYVVKMPKLGLEMEQGTVLEWYVDEGTEIEEDDVLLEVESEKSIGEVEAREDGVLRLLAIGEGETVPPGTPIGIVAGSEEDITNLEAELESGADSEGEGESGESAITEADAASDGQSGTNHSVTGDGETSEVGRSGGSADVKASPRAKKRAEEVGVALASVDGSGPGGAVTADDVEAAADGATTETGTESTESTDTGATAEQVRASPRAKDRANELEVDLGRVDGTGPQGAITAADVERAATADESSTDEASHDDRGAGERASGDRGTTGGAGADTAAAGRYQSATLVTDSGDGTADALVEATRLAREAFDLDVSVLDVLLVAVSTALTEHPALNATLEDDTHHVHGHQHVALAAGEGHSDLVVTNVTERSFAERVAAREGEAESGDDEHEQVTFALAAGESLGGSLEPPTVAGLAVDASRRRATPTENGEGVSLSRYLSCVLSYDPRAVGDRSARRFLETVCESIERAPELLLRTYR